MSNNLKKSRNRKVKAIIIDVDIDFDSHVVLNKIANSKGLEIEDVVVEAIQNFLTKYLIPLYEVYGT